MPMYRGTRYALLASAAFPTITLTGTSVSEDAAEGITIGTLSVRAGTGTYAFTITDDPDSKFEIGGDNADELQIAAALDYETATEHQVTVAADNSGGKPLSRTFTIQVLSKRVAG